MTVPSFLRPTGEDSPLYTEVLIGEVYWSRTGRRTKPSFTNTRTCHPQTPEPEPTPNTRHCSLLGVPTGTGLRT